MRDLTVAKWRADQVREEEEKRAKEVADLKRLEERHAAWDRAQVPPGTRAEIAELQQRVKELETKLSAEKGGEQ